MDCPLDGNENQRPCHSRLGGHARRVADVELAMGFERLIVVEPTASPAESLRIRILGTGLIVIDQTTNYRFDYNRRGAAVIDSLARAGAPVGVPVRLIKSNSADRS